jgi:hypothetical protein
MRLLEEDQRMAEAQALALMEPLMWMKPPFPHKCYSSILEASPLLQLGSSPLSQ